MNTCYINRYGYQLNKEKAITATRLNIVWFNFDLNHVFLPGENDGSDNT